jgi:hypothetical protein
LRRLRRRLTAGIFLDVWPRWATAGLLLSGIAALVCRLFFPPAAPFLAWLWLAPAAAVVPGLILCLRRVYGRAELVALADSLAGGHGTLLTLSEKPDAAWAGGPGVQALSTLVLPRWRLRRRLAPLLPAGLFLAVALLLPQRAVPQPVDAALATGIAEDLEAAVEVLKQQELITPEEENDLQEEIERIRRAALERVDAASWEAADALRERLAANLAEKQDAVKWAEDSLLRYAALGQAGGADSAAQAEELASALEKLEQLGLLAEAPEDLQKLFGGRGAAGGKFQIPSDPEALRRLAASLSEYLQGRERRFRELGELGRAFGRFDPGEFPLEFGPGPDLDGSPGTGGINRGRGDAPLTWGEETQPFDRFKAMPLPAGAARSPDEWAPITVLPGAPTEAPELSALSAARTYAGTAGQAAWRRSLAPRHHRAVRKYFESPAPSGAR